MYAVLALLAAGEDGPARRGLTWLRARQLPDGGWPPQTGFDESNWVTALAAMIPPEHLGARAHGRAIEWLLSTVGEETTLVFRLRRWLLGEPTRLSNGVGWPWVRGTAAWVVPTSLAVLALEKEYLRNRDRDIRSRVASGRSFLLERMCLNGGWNHGSLRVYGVDGLPYPETTGIALAAIRGVPGPSTDKSVAVALTFLRDCRSADSLNWLRMGLMAHGKLPLDYRAPALACRTVPETSVGMLVAETQKGREIFWG